MDHEEIEHERARTLVLDAGYQPVKIIDWRRAVCMTFLDKAEVLAHYAWSIHTVHRAYPAPAVIRLMVQLRHLPQVVRFSRRNVYIRDDHRCQYCGEYFAAADLTLDHVVPRSRGGGHTWDNVVAACRPCNVHKADRLLPDTRLELRRPPVVPRRTAWVTVLVEQVPEAWRPWLPAAA